MTDPKTPTMDAPTRAAAVEAIRDLIRRSAPSLDDDCIVARHTLRQRSGQLAALVVELADENATLRAELDEPRTPAVYFDGPDRGPGNWPDKAAAESARLRRLQDKQAARDAHNYIASRAPKPEPPEDF